LDLHNVSVIVNNFLLQDPLPLHATGYRKREKTSQEVIYSLRHTGHHRRKKPEDASTGTSVTSKRGNRGNPRSPLKPATPVTTNPSLSPTTSPSLSPVTSPSMSPVTSPSISPVTSPSILPVRSPSISPVGSPSISPVGSLSISPVGSPSASPVSSPSTSASRAPSNQASFEPVQNVTVTSEIKISMVDNSGDVAVLEETFVAFETTLMKYLQSRYDNKYPDRGFSVLDVYTYVVDVTPQESYYYSVSTTYYTPPPTNENLIAAEYSIVSSSQGDTFAGRLRSNGVDYFANVDTAEFETITVDITNLGQPS